jgi:hypothetical protein
LTILFIQVREGFARSQISQYLIPLQLLVSHHEVEVFGVTKLYLAGRDEERNLHDNEEERRKDGDEVHVVSH